MWPPRNESVQLNVSTNWLNELEEISGGFEIWLFLVIIKRPKSMIFQPYNHIIKIVLQSARARGYKERSVKNYKHLKNDSNHENPGVFSNSWPKGTQKQLVQVWGVNFAFSVVLNQYHPTGLSLLLGACAAFFSMTIHPDSGDQDVILLKQISESSEYVSQFNGRG